MKTRRTLSMLTIVSLVAGGLAVLASAPVEAQCLSERECNALKAQIRTFKEEAKPLREQAREIHKQARDLPRGSDERKTLRKQARELKKEFRQTRRSAEIRQVVRAFRQGCKGC